jgi:hypothetical protein
VNKQRHAHRITNLKSNAPEEILHQFPYWNKDVPFINDWKSIWPNSSHSEFWGNIILSIFWHPEKGPEVPVIEDGIWLNWIVVKEGFNPSDWNSR